MSNLFVPPSICNTLRLSYTVTKLQYMWCTEVQASEGAALWWQAQICGITCPSLCD